MTRSSTPRWSMKATTNSRPVPDLCLGQPFSGGLAQPPTPGDPHDNRDQLSTTTTWTRCLQLRRRRPHTNGRRTKMSTLIRRFGPTPDVSSFHDEVNRMFRDAFGHASTASNGAFTPALDIEED